MQKLKILTNSFSLKFYILSSLKIMHHKLLVFILGRDKFCTYQNTLWYYCQDNLLSKGYYKLANLVYILGFGEYTQEKPFSGCGYVKINSQLVPKEMQEETYEIFNDKYSYDHFVLRLLTNISYNFNDNKKNKIKVDFYFKDGFRDFSKFSNSSIYLVQEQVERIVVEYNKIIKEYT